jgi:hypothetical protein
MARSPRATHSIAIFCEMVDAVRSRGVPMHPRSASDKEYFAQDWFIDRLQATGLRYQQQGRNSYPDFWVYDDSLKEGYEIKSLAFVSVGPKQAAQGITGRPARKDIDFNSTVPSGQRNGRDVFLVFFLYTGSGSGARPVHTLSLAHADLINSDHKVADQHVNIAIKEFGSYGDGFIRNRKMYVLPHPVTIDPSGLGHQRLIVPTAWRLLDKRLKRVGRIARTVAERSVKDYKVSLYGAKPKIWTVPYANAGQALAFDVFEAV